MTLRTTYFVGWSCGQLCKVAVEFDGEVFANCRVNGDQFAFAGLPDHVRAELRQQAKQFPLNPS